MVSRISSGRVGQAAGFDPLASQRSAAWATQGIQQASSELSRLGARVEDDLQRGADFFNRAEGMRRQREISGDLAGIEETVSESGAGYSAAGMEALKQRQSESLGRAGNDPRKRKALEKQFALENERYQGEFERGERDWGDAYSNHEFLRGLDDSTQRTSRGSFVAPAKPAGENSAIGLIKKREGFISSAKWDVNAFRVGFGSDTITKADGSIVKVGRNTKVTREDAERDLARRTSEFQSTVIGQIGRGKWDGLSDGQKAALSSMAYNYGSLPKSVATAVKSGGDVGGAIRARGSDNKGINRERREEEANIFDTGHAAGIDQFGVPHHDGPIPDLSKNVEFQDELAAQNSVIDAMPISSLDKRKLKDQALNQLTAAAVGNMAQVNPSAALAYLRSGAADDALNFKQTGGLEDSLASQQKRLMESQIAAQAKAQASEFKTDAQDAADNFIASHVTGQEAQRPTPDQMSVLSREKRIAVEDAPHVAAARALGESAEPQDLAGIRKEIMDTVDPARAEKMLQKFDDAALDNRLDAAKSLSLLERQSLISQVGEGDLRDELVRQQNKFRSGMDSDQVGLIREAGGDVNDISSENFVGSLQERMSIVGDFSARNGVEPVLMSPEERLVFSEQFKEMTLPEKLAVMREVSQDAQLSDQFFSEISDVAPFLSHAGGMTANGGDIGAVSSAMRGYQAVLDGVKFDDITKADKSLALSSDMSEALRGMPSVLSEVTLFADNFAKGQSLDNGGVINVDDYQDGISKSLPDTFKYKRPGLFGGKTKSLLLPPETSELAFQTFMKHFSDEDVREMNGGELPRDAEGVELTADYIRKNADYMTVGPGRYVVEFDDGSTIGANGEPFILEYSDPFANMGDISVKFKGEK